MERLRGSGITTVAADVTYIDDVLRVTRLLSDDSVFVYRRV
jgi:hypothetical protein